MRLVHHLAAESPEERDEPEGLVGVEDDAVPLGEPVSVLVDGELPAHGDQLVAVRRLALDEGLVVDQHEVVPALVGNGPQAAVEPRHAARREPVEEGRVELAVEGPDELHHRVGADLVGGSVDEIGAAAGERGRLELAVELVGLEMDGRDAHTGVLGDEPVELPPQEKLLLGILLLPDDDLRAVAGAPSPAASGDGQKGDDENQCREPCHGPPPVR